MRILSAVCLFFTLSLLSTQEMDPIEWLFDINQVGPDTYELFFQAKLEEGWNIYSQEIAEDGPIATSINFTSDNVKPEAIGSESGDKKEGMDEMFGMEVIKYSSKEPFRMKQKVTVSDISKPVTGYVTYMLCNDTMCLPPKDTEFSFTIKVLNPLGGGH